MGLAKILPLPFQFFAINRSALIEPGVLYRRGGGNCQQLRPSKMILSKAVGFGVPDGKKPKGLARGYERYAQPGAKMSMSSKLDHDRSCWVSEIRMLCRSDRMCCRNGESSALSERGLGARLAILGATLFAQREQPDHLPESEPGRRYAIKSAKD